ncbi:MULTISPECIES: PA14 domain-containing protein [unclassified Streptomyces]|uniref:PA14 domain-containing protein n=1 Tax=unclassified Streptomyces TaxID=2593676 RepID=UPI000BACE041|nr:MULTISPECIES: PA14 domain-containing protein [unclassified Streptomyces]ASY31428.1 glycoside hydrolase family 2 [Streptomyces sp. CLI2509]MYX21545.1 glycoside hydrolase family 2 [Streptomyces sp. SID8380]
MPHGKKEEHVRNRSRFSPAGGVGRPLALCAAALLGLAGLTATSTASAADPGSTRPAAGTLTPHPTSTSTSHRTGTADAAELHGLRGDYYTQSAPGAFDFDQLKATAFDPSLDFDSLESRLQQATGQADDVNVRWTGRLVPGKSGEHTFQIKGDNGFRLWIGDELVIDHWVDDWDKEQVSRPVTLEAGKAYDIKLEYFEHEGGSNLHFSWTPPGGTQAPVPQSAFLTPENWAYDGATSATVTSTGRTLELGFPHSLATPPSTVAQHLSANIGGADWPLGTVRKDPADPAKLLVSLKEPVVGAGGSVDVRYDGEGGLRTKADAGDTAIGAFWAGGANESTYQLSTRWAKDVGPKNAHPEYPRPQLTRDRWQNLNGTWQFAAAKQGEAPPLGKNLAERVLVPYPIESQLSGIERHEDRMWYRRTFTVPANWKVGHGERLQLNFDAVDWQADIWVNGHKVTSHKGGYDRFSADVTDALKPGRTQELVVGVYDPTDAKNGENPPVGKQRLDPSGIWYTPSSGIWQTVWMEPVAAEHTDTLKLTPDVKNQRLAVDVNATRAGLPVTATAYDGKRKVATVHGRTGTTLRLPVRNPHLWSPDDPHLYRLEVTTGNDRVGSYFGMRDIAVENVDGTPRTVLNGKPVFMMATLDQGFWPDGLHTAPTDEALKYDLVQHKNLGFNSVRKHIKVEPDRWFYWADKLGLLVWQDMPAMSSVPDSASEKAEYEHEMKQMIDQHASSPSVIMWVTFNEGWGQYDQARIADQAKKWDPSRLVNNMSGLNCCGAVDGGNGDIADAHGYPSPALPAPDGKRALVSGEFGGLGLAVPGHAWPVQQSYIGVEKEAYTDEYLKKVDEVHALACEGGNGSVYTQIADVEGELNGIMTYDRSVMKADVGKVRAAQRALIADASRDTVRGCPTS